MRRHGDNWQKHYGPQWCKEEPHSSAGWYFHLEAFIGPNVSPLIAAVLSPTLALTVIWSDKTPLNMCQWVVLGEIKKRVYLRPINLNQRVAAGARMTPWFDDVCRRTRRDFYALWGAVERIYRIQRKSAEAYAEGCTQILKTSLLFFGQVEQKGSSYLRHAETKKDNLSIPCAYRCLEYLPPFTFQCYTTS